MTPPRRPLHATGGAMASWLFLLVLGAACQARSPCDGVDCAPTCPRDAERDGWGRCTCVSGAFPVLGACVPPAVADAYCGAASLATASGCVPRVCPGGEGVDVSTGACGPMMGGPSAPAVCVDSGTPVLSDGHPVCVPRSATCPRGTTRSAAAVDAPSHATCSRAVSCPPGSLPERVGPVDAGTTACRPVVTTGGRSGLPRVDVGAWASIALGPDGGRGSDDLCAPLSLRPDAFALPQGEAAPITIRITVSSPDQDLSRVSARVNAAFAGDGGDRPLSQEAEGLVERSVASLIEALRSLGGEASTAALELRVSCPPKSL